MEAVLKAARCNLCNKRLTDPRMLKCGHTFCRICLEEIFVEKDERTIILCESCQCETVLQSGQTTFDLHTNDALQKVLDVLPKESDIVTVESTKYSFTDLKQMIDKKNIGDLRSAFSAEPSAIKLRGGDNNRTLLMEALFPSAGNEEIVDLLLKTGCHVCDEDQDERNALHYCSEYAHSLILSKLLSIDNSCINKVDLEGKTPLFYASYGGNIECVKTLMMYPHLDVSVRTEAFLTARLVAGVLCNTHTRDEIISLIDNFSEK